MMKTLTLKEIIRFLDTHINKLLLDKINKCDFSFAIKFILNYNDTDSKRSVLKQYFN